MAGASGAVWRMEPSPKYSVAPSSGSGVAGKMKGMAEEASRCACVIWAAAALRWLRTQGWSRSCAWQKVTCSLVV